MQKKRQCPTLTLNKGGNNEVVQAPSSVKSSKYTVHAMPKAPTKREGALRKSKRMKEGKCSYDANL